VRADLPIADCEAAESTGSALALHMEPSASVRRGLVSGWQHVLSR